jgi:hypothetical protein
MCCIFSTFRSKKIAFELLPNWQVLEGDLIIQFLLFNHNFHGCLFISC